MNRNYTPFAIIIFFTIAFLVIAYTLDNSIPDSEADSNFMLKTMDSINSGKFKITSSDNASTVFLIESPNRNYYENSTISINMSYINEVRYENNTMIISIIKE